MVGVTKKEAAEQLAIVVAEIRLALDAGDEDCPSWADDILAIADALDPSGFVEENAARHRLEEIRDLREKVAFLERQRDRALSDRNAWEQACRDNDARLGVLVTHVGWEIAQPIIDRVNEELANAR